MKIVIIRHGEVNMNFYSWIFSRTLLHELVERGFKINKNKIRMNNLEEITAYK